MTLSAYPLTTVSLGGLNQYLEIKSSLVTDGNAKLSNNHITLGVHTYLNYQVLMNNNTMVLLFINNW